MLYSGFVSATFRSLKPKEIIGIAKCAGAEVIEWSSRDHLLPGDTRLAGEIRKMMDDCSLTSPTYGTYYYAGKEGTQNIGQLIDNARILGSKVLRVWAGWFDSSNALSPDERKRLTEELRNICNLAAQNGLKVSTEYHNNTLTDSFESTCQLLGDIPELYTHWQADDARKAEGHVQVLKALLPRITAVHAAWWQNRQQCPFSDGAEVWQEYIDILKQDKSDHPVLLEFVKNGTPEQLCEDIAALKRLIGNN